MFLLVGAIINVFGVKTVHNPTKVRNLEKLKNLY